MRQGADEDASRPEAFAAALALEIPGLRRLARMLVNRPDSVDDLVQETLMRAIAARDQFTLGTNLRAWLFTILRHARVAEARRAARSPIRAAPALPDPPVSGGQEERQAVRDLIAALQTLPPIQRQALWLVVVEGLDYGDAAAVQGVPQGTLRSRLSRAREALRRGIGQEVPRPRAAAGEMDLLPPGDGAARPPEAWPAPRPADDVAAARPAAARAAGLPELLPPDPPPVVLPEPLPCRDGAVERQPGTARRGRAPPRARDDGGGAGHRGTASSVARGGTALQTGSPPAPRWIAPTMHAADARAMLQAGMALQERGDGPGAERLYRQVLARWPGEPNALSLLGVLLRERGALAEALRLGAEAVARDPSAGVFLANQGATLAAAGRFAEAAAMLGQAVARRPDDPVTLRNLGQALAEMGDAEAALLPLENAVALQPGAPEGWLALAHARRRLGDAAAAAEAAETALAHAADRPALAEQAAFMLAALGRAPLPDRAPAGYVRDLFDGFAPRFEAQLSQGLDYRTPQLLAALLAEAGVAAERRLCVLDLGCGTGLSGEVLAPFAARLEGLDLSPRMLAEAARRPGLYDALHEADLLAWLPAQAPRFDLILAADVLVYLGDLQAPLAGIAGALVPGGLCAFSLEEGEPGQPYALGEVMRYRHDPAATTAIAAANGLAQREVRRGALRREAGRDVPGALFLFEKRG